MSHSRGEWSYLLRWVRPSETCINTLALASSLSPAWQLTACIWEPRKGLQETGPSVQTHLISEAALSWVMGCCRRMYFLWGPPHIFLHGQTSGERIHSLSAASFVSPSMVTLTCIESCLHPRSHPPGSSPVSIHGHTHLDPVLSPSTVTPIWIQSCLHPRSHLPRLYGRLNFQKSWKHSVLALLILAKFKVLSDFTKSLLKCVYFFSNISVKGHDF